MKKQLYVEIIGKTEKYNQAIDAAQSKLEGFAGKSVAIGAALSAAITAPMIAFGFEIKNSASRVEQSISKIGIVFGKYSDSVKNFANDATKSFGMSQSAAYEFVGAFGNLATSIGLSQGQASEMSKKLVGLAGDLSSLNDVSQEVAANALKGIFTGEGESLKQFGVIMQDSTLNTYALAKGIKVKYSEMDQASKVALRYNYVLEATKNASGNFSKTQLEEANQARLLSANYENLKVKLGNGLLPIYTKVEIAVNKVIEGFNNMSDSTRDNIITFGAIAGAVGPGLLALGGIVTVLPLISKGFLALISPVGLATAAIIAGGILAWSHWDKFINGLFEIRRAWHQFTDSFVTDSVIKDKKWQKDLDNDVAFYENWAGKKQSVGETIKHVQKELANALNFDFKAAQGSSGKAGGISDVSEKLRKLSIDAREAMNRLNDLRKEISSLNTPNAIVSQLGRSGSLVAENEEKGSNIKESLKFTPLGFDLDETTKNITEKLLALPERIKAPLSDTTTKIQSIIKQNFDLIDTSISMGVGFLGDLLAQGMASIFNKDVKFDFKKMLGQFLQALGDYYLRLSVPLIAGGILANIGAPGTGAAQLTSGLKLGALGAGLKGSGVALSTSGGNDSIVNSPNTNFQPTYTPNYQPQGTGGKVEFEIQGSKLVGVLNTVNNQFGN